MPFEERKRQAVIPLLYVQHAFMVAVVAFVAYGSYAVATRPAQSCYSSIKGLTNPYNAVTAVVCSLWGMLAVFLCALADNRCPLYWPSALCAPLCRLIGWIVFNSLQAAEGDFSAAARMTPWEQLVQRLAWCCCCTGSISSLPSKDEDEQPGR